MLESGRDVARAGGAGARRGREARRCGAGDGVAWCPAVSHAIPSEYLASSYRFVYLSHSCLGIACDFGEGGRKWGATGEHLGQAGCKWAQLGPKSHVFAGGKKFGRKRMAGQRVFVAMLDALGMTPAWE